MTTEDLDYTLVTAIEKYAVPLADTVSDYDSIIHAAKEKKLVMIGEATHGTKEFYAMRAEITKRLIQELNFDAIAVEADWPDAYAVNRYVSLMEPLNTAEEALATFERFPTWMWQNSEVLNFIKWLHDWNAEFRRPIADNKHPVAFYGLDLYSMNTSVHAVIDYLDKANPAAAERARQRYGCLDRFMDDLQLYGHSAESGLIDSCEKQIVSQLIELRRRAHEYLERDGLEARDEYFSVSQNAKLIRNAEQYYRSLFSEKQHSWNVRDRHMFDTLTELFAHLGRRKGSEAKIVVWAHNSHVGNAAATDMGQRGEFNIGQLACETHGDEALLIGFSTSHGTVTAASNWDEPPEYKNINIPFPRSYEESFHHVKYKNFLIDLRENNGAVDMLMEPRLQRVIGVIYKPMHELQSHYYRACLPEQFDFIIHLDQTSAVHPLEAIPHWHRGEMDETYPFGM